MKTKEEKKSGKTKDTSAKITLLGFFTALLILLFAVAAVTAAELQVHEGESIQAVINMAKPGDTIIVHNGTYTENVVVNKSDILIRSANCSAVTIVQSNRTDMHVFNITDQKNVTLDGFTVRDASAAPSMTKGLIAMSLSALVLPPEYQKGKIKVTSKPSGATIGLDGVWYRMGTPNVIENVEPGHHTVSLRLNGYQDWSKRVQVKAGETRDVHATLTAIPTTGSISVTSVPSGASIYVDTYLGWSYKGKTPNTITAVSPDYLSLIHI